MVSKMREILLTQYIGSILIALLVIQAATEVVTRVVNIGFWLFNYRHTHSVFESPSVSFPWDKVIFSAVTAVLYMMAAYSLARWLYLPAVPTNQPGVEATPIPEVQEQP